MDEVRKKQIAHFYPGCIIYKYEGEELIQARIIEYKNSQDWFNVHINNKLEHLNTDDVLDNWTLLNPDGVITINIVKLQQGNDIMLCMHPIKNLDPIPEVVCRQSIVDVFSDSAYRISPEYKMTGKEVMFVGMSISKETCPADIDFRVILSCESIQSTSKYAYYMEDGLEDFLKYIKNIKKYDKLMVNIKNNGLESYKNSVYSEVTGYNQTLKDLIVNTGFMKDIRTAFGIIEIPFGIIDTVDNIIMSNDPRLDMFSFIVRKPVKAMYIMKYSREIDLEEIKRNYVLAIPKFRNEQSSTSHDLYIIAYDAAK